MFNVALFKKENLFFVFFKLLLLFRSLRLFLKSEYQFFFIVFYYNFLKKILLPITYTIYFFKTVQNEKPKANAGDDFEIDLPRTLVTLNGTKSSDDWAVKRWKWTRHETSLAVGKIAEGTDETALLQLTDLVVGRYVFNLTVYDEQGLSDTDTVSFIVRNDPKLYYLVEITLDEDVKMLTQAQYATLNGKLQLLVQDGTRLQVRNKN